MSLQPESDFFGYIATEVRKLVVSFDGRATVTKYKAIAGDYATEVDVAVEKLIVAEIQKRFPGDLILAEEGYSDVEIPSGRIWIIDPICGTTNLKRGITSFCTNIALADSNVLIASCVIDHSQNDYFWSIGNNEVFINNQPYIPPATNDDVRVVIDLDLSALENVDDQQKKNHTNAAFVLSRESGYMLQSLGSSLGFAYTAVGKIDGFINAYNHPWDICAASFLIQQAGGVITQLDGSPWGLTSIGAIGSKNIDIHKKLLNAYSAT